MKRVLSLLKAVSKLTGIILKFCLYLIIAVTLLNLNAYIQAALTYGVPVYVIKPGAYNDKSEEKESKPKGDYKISSPRPGCRWCV